MADQNKQVGTTGHQWDDDEGYPLKELNNPLPRWWLYTFYATIVWAVVYWVLYPAWPLPGGFTRGMLGWSSIGQLNEEMDQAKVARKEFDTKLQATSLDAINKDPKLLAYAMSGGKSVYGDNCAPCHGSSGTGAVGFPSLRDDDWLYGGTLADINETLNNGRQAMMPAHLKSAGGAFEEAQVKDLVEYVSSLSGGQADAAAAKRGDALFHGDAACNACHGDTGKGAVLDSTAGAKIDKSIGAPNLTDAVWLYGGDKATLFKSIAQGRNGRMPAWGTGYQGLGKQLSELQVKQLVLYVHSLGGGK